MTAPERLSKLVALLAITFCWAHLTGEWLHKQKPIKVKKHGRKAISIFRYGFDHLRELVLNISERYQEFQEMVALLWKSLTASPLSLSDKKDSKQKRKYEYFLPQEECTITLARAA